MSLDPETVCHHFVIILSISCLTLVFLSACTLLVARWTGVSWLCL